MTANSQMLVVADGLAKHWPTGGGVSDVDIQVAAGEFVALIGPSGSGKSTVLDILAGWVAPDRGRVAVLGNPPNARGAWTDVAVVPQSLALCADLSVGENIAAFIPTALRGEVKFWVEELAIADLLDRGIDELSHGQRQRVAVARAVAAQPRVILIDEPTAFQDHQSGAHLAEVLTAAAARGSALLVATHDPDLIDAADRTLGL